MLGLAGKELKDRFDAATKGDDVEITFHRLGAEQSVVDAQYPKTKATSVVRDPGVEAEEHRSELFSGGARGGSEESRTDAKMSQTKSLMADNAAALNERRELIDQIQEETGELHSESQNFGSLAQQIKRRAENKWSLW